MSFCAGGAQTKSWPEGVSRRGKKTKGGTEPVGTQVPGGNQTRGFPNQGVPWIQTYYQSLYLDSIAITLNHAKTSYSKHQKLVLMD